MGAAAGKYSSTVLPTGPRAQIYASILENIDPVLALMREVGEGHGGKTPVQVGLVLYVNPLCMTQFTILANAGNATYHPGSVLDLSTEY